jgi:hypothetical protein
MLALLATTNISYIVFGARPVNVALFVVEPFEKRGWGANE